MQTYENMRNAIDGHAGYSILTPAERAAVLNAIDTCSTVLEIGTFQGTTVSEWAKRRPMASFLSVDNFSWVGDGSRRENIGRWIDNQQPNMRLFVGTVQELFDFCSYFPHLDLVIIDGDHSYQACKKDLATAKALLRIGGTIAVHDYATDNPSLCGVTKAVDEFCAEYHVSIHHTKGTVAFIQC